MSLTPLLPTRGMPTAMHHSEYRDGVLQHNEVRDVRKALDWCLANVVDGHRIHLGVSFDEGQCRLDGRKELRAKTHATRLIPLEPISWIAFGFDAKVRLEHQSGAAFLDVVEHGPPRLTWIRIRLERCAAPTKFGDLGFVRAHRFEGQTVPELLGQLDTLVGRQNA